MCGALCISDKKSFVNNIIIVIIIIRQHPQALQLFNALWTPAEDGTKLLTSIRWKVYLAWIIVIESNLLNVTTRDHVTTEIGHRPIHNDIRQPPGHISSVNPLG